VAVRADAPEIGARASGVQTLDALYESHAPQLRRRCLRLTRDPAAADDLMQEVLARFIARFPEPPAAMNVGGYLHTMAGNVLWKQRRDHHDVADGDIEFSAGADDHLENDPERSSLLLEQQHLVRRCAAMLTGRQRRALTLREVEGHSYAEIGSELGIGTDAVAQVISRARVRLRDVLRRAQVDLERLSPECRTMLGPISDYVDGKAGSETPAIEAHLAECADCRNTLASFQEAGSRLRGVGPFASLASMLTRLGSIARVGGEASTCVAGTLPLAVAALIAVATFGSPTLPGIATHPVRTAAPVVTHPRASTPPIPGGTSGHRITLRTARSSAAPAVVARRVRAHLPPLAHTPPHAAPAATPPASAPATTGASAASPKAEPTATPKVVPVAVKPPAVKTPGVTTPGVATPGVTKPGLTPPKLTVPGVALPPISTPTVTVPAVVVPPATVPPVTVPPVTVPPIVMPAIGFSVLAGAGVTNTGPSSISGDIGSFPTAAITGLTSLTVGGTNHAADAATQQAKLDLVTAYDTAASAGSTSTIAADLGGRTLVPGVYTSASSIGLTGVLTLDGRGNPNAVFVFQAGSTLTTASASRVNLINGAQSCNVYWQVGSSATLGTGSSFRGSIVALTSITVTTGVAIDGRVLARNGAVTLDSDTITTSACAHS
jgi:RNA polymerase sigma factor (sigma-70 family)